MTPPVLVDTNVVVAGILTASADSPVCRILDAMLAGELRFLLSVELLEEYRRVLARPAIRALHGLTEEAIDRVLTELAANALIREAGDAPESTVPDPGDAHLWRLLRTTPGAVLVTGDRKLLAGPPAFASCMSPRAFLETFGG